MTEEEFRKGPVVAALDKATGFTPANPYASPKSVAEIDALMRLIRDEVLQANRRLMMKFPFTGDQARRMIRVEVNHEVEMDFEQWIWETCQDYRSPHDRVGPSKLVGFDVYVVRNLPAPGWRVINPMEAKWPCSSK